MRMREREPARWFRRPDWQRAVARTETLHVAGGAFRASFRACADGGYVVSFPALPQLMTRAASYPHARIRALALIQRYLVDVAAREGAASSAPSALPLAA